jgi:hypothetical protein
LNDRHKSAEQLLLLREDLLEHVLGFGLLFAQIHYLKLEAVVVLGFEICIGLLLHKAEVLRGLFVVNAQGHGNRLRVKELARAREFVSIAFRYAHVKGLVFADGELILDGSALNGAHAAYRVEQFIAYLFQLKVSYVLIVHLSC